LWKGSILLNVGNDRADGDVFAVPSKVYPASVSLLSIDMYREEMLTGYVVSAGGLGESLVAAIIFFINADTCCVDGFG
jgi:hypothetical protein